MLGVSLLFLKGLAQKEKHTLSRTKAQIVHFNISGFYENFSANGEEKLFYFMRLLYPYDCDTLSSYMAQKNQSGSVILMLLVVIAIGLIIYYIDMVGMTGGNRMIQKQEKPEDQPWANENLIRDANHPAKAAKKAAANTAKPVITKPLALKGEVALKTAQRGQVVFTIQPDGTLSGDWQCRYSYTHAAYVITATFAGNTDTTQNAPDDASKLYLVANGDFIQKETNLESGEITETKGTVYFGGWLGTNLAAFGTLSITTDKKWHADYTWTAK